MDARFDAVIWWLKHREVDGAKISMDDVVNGLDQYRKAHKAEGGKLPDIGAVSRAALYRDFGTVEAMMEHILKYLQAHDESTPPALHVFLTTGRRSRKAKEEKKAGAFNGDVTIGDLVQAVEQAEADGDSDELVARLEQLSARYLKEPAHPDQIETYLDKAFQAARRGYEVGKESSKRGRRKRILEEQMLCARSAAWAMIQMSRRKLGSDPSGADLYLSRAVTWKRNEEELAIALKLPLTATVARFHADRGLAVLDDNLEQSLVVLRDISTYLLQHKGAGAELNDKVRYHDLTNIIQRMCTISGAAQGHPVLSRLVNKYFPAPKDIDSVIEDLSDLYSNEGRGPEARRDIAALMKAREMYDALQREYEDAPEGSVSEQDGVDSAQPDPERVRKILEKAKPLIFMRISEFEALHALVFARFATAAHDVETRTEIGITGFPPAEELLVTASNLCYRAYLRTRDKAVDNVVRELLKKVHQSIPLSKEKRQSVNVARRERAGLPVGSGGPRKFVSDLLEDIDGMLWKMMTSAPLTLDEAYALTRTARDIDRYLSGSRKVLQDKGIKNDPA